MADSASADHLGRSIRPALLMLARLAILPVLVGCATSSQLAEQHPLDRRGTPQAVAVIASPVAPETRMRAFAVGESEGASKGAAGGAAVGASFVLLLVNPLAIVYFPAIVGAIAAAGMAAGAATGAAVGAELAVPAERAAAIERLATDAMGQLRLSERTAAAVASGATKFAELDATIIDGAVQADVGTDRGLRARGFGVAIEFKLKEIGFEAARADTVMSLYLTAEANLVDTTTGKPVARRGLVYVSPRHAHEFWTRDGGALTKAETERACNTLAERMVEDLLLGATAGPARPGTYTRRDVCGLAPSSPALAWGSRGPAESEVESVMPLLAWESEPAPAWSSDYHAWDPTEHPTDETPWSRAKPGDITYDLRIWSVVDGAPDALVYERLKLPQPQHRVEIALAPGSTYFWSVRMRYVVDGRMQATRWSAAADLEYPLSPHLKKALSYARVDDGTVKPLACTACQCLDFTPAPNYFRFRTP
jgi:hypothetical protein